MTDTLTHALTIHQPYAWAVAAGHKPVENRTWRPPLEAVGKLIGIHAGLGTGRDALGDYLAVLVAMGARRAEVPDMKRLQRGALIGVARLVGVVRAAQDQFLTRSGRDVTAQRHGFMKLEGRSALAAWRVSDDLADRIRPWWRGPWGWLLEEAVLLPEPIPMRGQQGLWRLPTHPNPVLPGELRSSAAWALEQWRKARETR